MAHFKKKQLTLLYEVLMTVEQFFNETSSNRKDKMAGYFCSLIYCAIIPTRPPSYLDLCNHFL